MVGQKCGRLTVTREKPIDEYPDGKRKCVQWYCDCDCGTKDHLVDGTQLRRGKIKSCGCLKIDSAKNGNIDISGQKFGMLVAKKRVAQPENIKCKMGAWWLCECDCGGGIISSYSKLKSGNTKSCGCLISNGERIIRQILIKNKVNFQTQYSFEDCRSNETGRLLKFDFAIFDKEESLYCVIEFDGQQHYFGTRFSKNKEHNKEKFRKLKLYDSIKTDYCTKNKINLLRIPYWEIENIESIIDKNIKERCYGI